MRSGALTAANILDDVSYDVAALNHAEGSHHGPFRYTLAPGVLIAWENISVTDFKHSNSMLDCCQWFNSDCRIDHMP